MTNPNRSDTSAAANYAAYDVFLAANRKGGIGKTMIIVFLIACALMRKAKLRAFEIDRQSRLERMYPAHVTQVDLPDTDQLIDDDLSEGRALALVFNALRSDKKEGLVFVDIGANHDERVAKGLLRARMSKRIAEAERSICVLIPLDGASDTIVAAGSAVVQFTIAVPQAHIVFVQRQAKLVVDTSATSTLSDDAKKAYAEVIAPLHTADRILNMGQMRKGVHKAFVAMSKNPLEFMDCTPHLLGAAATDVGGDVLENEFAGEEILGYFEDFIGQIDEEAQRVLGFRTGLDEPKRAKGENS